tara:strand:+ start:1575 stop:1859 length:285 start_codon:yes stop_codon:yes gene_type:complete
MNVKNFCSKGNLVTVRCNPGNRKLWFKNQDKIDPVQSNIQNGCWICNIDQQQKENSKLCERSLFNPNTGPCEFVYDVNVIRGMQQSDFKTHPIR